MRTFFSHSVILSYFDRLCVQPYGSIILDPQYVIPSHGQPFRGGTQRIEEIKSHHEQRLAHMLGLIGPGKNAYEICLDVFGTGLNAHEMRFAIGETIAHLEYLHQEGQCEKVQLNGKWMYAKK